MTTMRQIVDGTRSGRIDPRDLVQQVLDRVAKYDTGLRAWVNVDDVGARRQAESIAQKARSGLGLERLAGTIWGVKDIIDIQGQVTQCGSATRIHAAAADRDAQIVQWLRQSDAIVVGRTACCEFACFDPCETVNPWDARCTPGGSSSGSAAAVAAEMCHAAWGTQTGGSIIRPAAFCGVTGLKARYGAWPTAGVSPVSRLLDHVGPLTRCVEDLAVIWSAWTRESIATPQPPPSIAVVREWWSTHACPAQEDALHRLASAGVRVVDFRHPWNWDELRAAHRRIMAYEAALWHGWVGKERGQDPRTENKDVFQVGPRFRELVEEGRAISREAFVDAVALQRAFSLRLRDLGQEAPLMVTPGASGPAPRNLKTTGDPAFHSPWSMAGCCSLALPCGLQEGLPVALQLVAPAASELEFLKWALWCEQQLPAQPSPDLTRLVTSA